MRWSVKFIGLISTIILARILTPDDFGLVAMATLVIALIEEFSTINVSLLLIRASGNDIEQSNTAWTIGIVQSFLLAALLVVFAPFAADYFNDPRVTLVIYILAFIKIAAGFQNIGMVLARKELNFSLDFKFIVYRRVSIFLAVVSLALIYQNYWAIVFGTLIGEVVSVWLSYKFHPYRPSVSFTFAKEYIRFAIPMIPLSIARLLNNKFDVIVVGGNTGTSQMGIYNVANELGSVFTKEVILPTARGLFPNFTRLAEDRAQFVRVYLNILSATFVFSAPVVAGMWLVADNFVYVVLGQQWMETTEFLKLLILYGAVSSVITIMAEHPLIALKMEYKANSIMWLRVSVLIICVIYGFKVMGIYGAALGMACSSLINLPLVIFLISRLLNIKVLEFIKASVSPILSAGFMFAIVSFLVQPHLSTGNHYFDLAVSTCSGGVLYLCALILLWHIRGKPDSIEKILVNKIKRR